MLIVTDLRIQVYILGLRLASPYISGFLPFEIENDSYYITHTSSFLDTHYIAKGHYNISNINDFRSSLSFSSKLSLCYTHRFIVFFYMPAVPACWNIELYSFLMVQSVLFSGSRRMTTTWLFAAACLMRLRQSNQGNCLDYMSSAI